MAAVLWVALALFVGSLFGHVVHWSLHQRWTGPAHRGHMEHHLELYPPWDLTSATYLRAKWYHSGTFLFAPVLVVTLMAARSFCASWTFCFALTAFALLNDWTHDRFHVPTPWLEWSAYYRRMRKAHFAHHRNMRRNYGIVSLAWDRVFGTAV